MVKLFWAIFKAARPRQWIKNFAVFAALIFSGTLFDSTNQLKAFEGFLLFCIFSSATYLLNDDQLGADATQEGFIKAYINLNGFDTKKKFSSWIYRIVHNEAMNLINKNKKYTMMNAEVEYDSGVDLEDELIKKELITRTHQCLDKMPILYKEPLSLFFLDEKSYEEISDILRIPTGTVGTRINRAKIIMKKICQTIKK